MHVPFQSSLEGEMLHNATTSATTPYMPPLPASLAVLPTPELMAAVMRQVGPGCALADFQQAAETCDLTEVQLKANIGAAKRILLMETERNDFPAAPVHPWDIDRDYRKELVAAGGRLVALGFADTAAIVASLDRGGIEPAAMIDLWDDIVSEAIRQFHQQPRLAPLAGIIADLTAAVDAYDSPRLNAEARNLVHSMRSALDGLAANQPLPRRHVLATINAFAAVSDWSDFDQPHREKVATACTTLRKLWGL